MDDLNNTPRLEELFQLLGEKDFIMYRLNAALEELKSENDKKDTLIVQLQTQLSVTQKQQTQETNTT